MERGTSAGSGQIRCRGSRRNLTASASWLAPAIDKTVLPANNTNRQRRGVARPVARDHGGELFAGLLQRAPACGRLSPAQRTLSAGLTPGNAARQ